MIDLVPIVVPVVFFLLIYRIFELYVRKEERLKIVENMKHQINVDGLNEKLNLPMFGKMKSSSFTILRAALLMIGVGLGLGVAFFIEIAIAGQSVSAQNFDWEIQHNVNRYMTVIYPASVAMFGGIGLLIAYFIERKAEKE